MSCQPDGPCCPPHTVPQCVPRHQSVSFNTSTLKSDSMEIRLDRMMSWRVLFRRLLFGSCILSHFGVRCTLGYMWRHYLVQQYLWSVKVGSFFPVTTWSQKCTVCLGMFVMSPAFPPLVMRPHVGVGIALSFEELLPCDALCLSSVVFFNTTVSVLGWMTCWTVSSISYFPPRSHSEVPHPCARMEATQQCFTMRKGNAVMWQMSKRMSNMRFPS